MKKTKKGMILTALIAGVLLTGCGTATSEVQKTEEVSTGESGEVFNIKVGNVLVETDPINIGLKSWADAVKEKTDGKVIIEIFPNSQLGDTADMIEQVVAGSDVGVMADTGLLADYVPDMAIYTAPYVFNSVENARKFVDSNIFKEWNEELSKVGIRNLGFNWYQGARNFLTNKPINSMDDLKGLRVRTMGTKVAQDAMSAFGCVPTTLAWSEVYSGLQSNVIDALEAQTTAVYGASLQETVTHITKTEHFLLYTGIIVSEKWWSRLPEEYKTIIKEQAIIAGDYATELTIDSEQQLLDKIAEEGVTISDIDKTPFIESSKIVYEENNWGDLKTRIDQEVGQ